MNNIIPERTPPRSEPAYGRVQDNGRSAPVIVDPSCPWAARGWLTNRKATVPSTSTIGESDRSPFASAPAREFDPAAPATAHVESGPRSRIAPAYARQVRRVLAERTEKLVDCHRESDRMYRHPYTPGYSAVIIQSGLVGIGDAGPAIARSSNAKPASFSLPSQFFFERRRHPLLR